MGEELYDRMGVGYAAHRRAETRIAGAIIHALGSVAPVVNVGAGTGSYEPRDRELVAVEPARAMIRQRDRDSAPVVQASAMQLPFADGAFAAALALLTIHHWPDRARGLAELGRVTRQRIVVLTCDVDAASFWLIDDYFPAIRDLDRGRVPRLEEFSRLGRVSVRVVPIPHDCSDGFLGAYWRRPGAYLDPAVRSAISAFAGLARLEAGVARLARDLADGTWERRHGAVLEQTELDIGYRLVTIERT